MQAGGQLCDRKCDRGGVGGGGGGGKRAWFCLTVSIARCIQHALKQSAPYLWVRAPHSRRVWSANCDDVQIVTMCWTCEQAPMKAVDLKRFKFAHATLPVASTKRGGGWSRRGQP
jgi:hypothetical protein